MQTENIFNNNIMNDKKLVNVKRKTHLKTNKRVKTENSENYLPKFSILKQYNNGNFKCNTKMGLFVFY